MFIDQHGLIVQKDGDGGDTAQREGFLACSDAENSWFPGKCEYSEAVDLLEVKPGIWVRHPDQWNDPKDFSRDQQTPHVWAMAKHGLKAPLRRMFWAHLKRFGKYQNWDFMSPEHLGLYIRAFVWIYPWIVIPGSLALYSLLLFGDIFNLINTLVRIYKGRKDPDDVGDDLNHLVIIRASQSFPTPISWISRVIYFKYRPGYTWTEVDGKQIATLDPTGCGPQYALNRYFRAEAGGNPELALCWRAYNINISL